MDKNKIIKLAGNYFNLINDAIININELFINQTNEYKRIRQIMVQNIINLRRQQLLLIIAAYSNDLNYERSLWQLDRTKSFWEVDCQLFSDEMFKQNFRMNRTTFNELCMKLKPFEKEGHHWRRIPLEKKVAIALYCMGSSAELRSISNLFGVGKSTVCVLFIQFCKIVWNVLSPQYLNHFPLTKEKIEECVNGFERLGFPQCLGAIDGCHIEVHPNASDAVDYYNYKGWYSTILFALVDYRYRFLYINVGSPGRCNDSQIFEKSLLKKYLNECPLLDEMSKNLSGVDVPVLIMGDSAFRLSKRVMKPYPFNVDDDKLKKQFNYVLSKSRRVVENGFGHLKARFRRIGKGIDNNIDNAKAIIKAGCVLHNYLNEKNDEINAQWLQDAQNSMLNGQIPQPETFLMTENSGEIIRQAISSYFGATGVDTSEIDGDDCDMSS